MVERWSTAELTLQVSDVWVTSHQNVSREQKEGTVQQPIYGVSVFLLSSWLRENILSYIKLLEKNRELVLLDFIVVIVDQDPSRLTGDHFSENLKNFVERCLQKKVSDLIRLGGSYPFLGRIPTDESMSHWCRANQLLV